MAKSITQDMTKGSPMKLILQFTIPMLIGNIFQQFYNMVDSIVVGKYVGKDALAAVGATGSLVFLIIGLCFGLSAGISIVISQYFGAKDYDNVKKAFATATYIVVGMAVILGTLGFIFSRHLLLLLDTPLSIIDDADIYMKITFAGMIGVACYNGMAAVLRALGDSITPLIFLAVASVLNVVLDLLFVVVFHWDVPGVAIATIISQIISAIGCILYAFKKVDLLKLKPSEFKIDKGIFKQCIRLGIPVALQNSFVSISMMALQSVINGFNETVIAAYTASNRIEQLVLQPGMSVGAAIAAFTGQNIGANKVDRAKKGFRAGATIIIILGLVMLPVMYFGGEYIMRMFTKKEDFEVVQIGLQGIRITSFFYIPVGMIFVSRNFLSGSGDIHIPMWMGICEVVCRVTFSMILAGQIGHSGIWWATALNWAVTAILGVGRVLSGRWKSKSLIQNAI